MNTTPTRAKDKKYLACKCKHEYFDSVFGHGVRPHNPTKDKQHRCVVCSDKKAG